MVAVTRKKFTIDEYHKLLDLGFFSENDRVELIRGEIIETTPKTTPHSVCNSLLWKQLYELIGKQAEIRVQEPIILPSNSEPEPDVVIARKKTDNYLSAHPTVRDLILVIEISDSTLKYDREAKLPLYAEAGINNYWIVNLVDRCLEIYSNPFSNNQEKFNYRNKSIILSDEQADLPEFIEVKLELISIFPK